MALVYEDILDCISHLPKAREPGEHDVHWLTIHRVLGVARAFDGKIEIFIKGPALSSSSDLVRQTVEHQGWFSRGRSASVSASRISLPRDPHFVPAAAFLCTELARNGIEKNPAAGFRRTEPYIEMVIRRLLLSDEAVVGLAGELLLLQALCLRAPASQVSLILKNWNGWRESSRDLVLGSIGVEVKTTLRPSSTHHIQGLHQVEVRVDGVGQQTEEDAFLVSVGLVWSEQAQQGVSISSLVESILELIRRSDEPDYAPTFLARVREYGASADIGYDHETMATSPRFARSFAITFVRCYDLSDPALKLLRTADVDGATHVSRESIRYQVNLPDHVSGDVNPITGMHRVSVALLSALAS